MKVFGTKIIIDMKPSILFLFTILMFFISCERKENACVGTTEDDNFYCHIEDNESTKTQLNDNYNIIWSSGDQLAIFKKSSVLSKYQINENHVGKTSGSFNKVNNDDLTAGFELSHNVALYPYLEDIEINETGSSSSVVGYQISALRLDDEQEYVAGSFAAGTFPMVAVSSSNELTFMNICGGMRLLLKGTQNVTSIMVEGKNAEKLSGDAVISVDADGSAPVIEMRDDALGYVILNCGDGVQLNENEATEFIIVLPPTSFTKGFTVTVTDKDGVEKIVDTDSENHVYRSSMLMMPTIDLSAGEDEDIKIPDDKTQVIIFEDAAVKDLCVLYWDENFDDELSYEEAGKVTDIGTAFRGTSITSFDELKYFTSLERIEDNAFKNCTSLAEITLGSAVTYLGASSFEGCSSLVDFNIPDGVTSINDKTFYNCTSLAKFPSGNNLTTIGTYAFEGCTGLTSIVIPECVSSIGSGAFLGCSGLTSVVISEGVTSIGSTSFAYCSNLKTISVPKTVTSIEASAFMSCTGEIFIDCDIKGASSCYRSPFYEAKFTDIIIGENASSIGSYAFYELTTLTDIQILGNLKSIGGSAFYGCSGITSISLPDSITSLYGFAFQDCTGLRSINIPENVTAIESYLFEGCTSLESVEMNDKITIIEQKAFHGCEKLTDITLPESIATIEESAFEGCESLKTIRLSNILTEIPEKTFYGCKSLSRVRLGLAVEHIGKSAFEGCSGLTMINLPNGLATIEIYAFRGCSSMKTLTIPESVTCINNRAFEGCTGELTINASRLSSSGMNGYSEDSGIFHNGAFSKVTIGESVTSIPSYAFCGCTGELFVNCNIPNRDGSGAFYKGAFSKVVIGDGVTSIGEEAFYECSELTSVYIPSSVTSIGSRAFENCSGELIIDCNVPESFNRHNFTKIIIGEGVTSIGQSAFYNCTSLIDVELPQSLRMIGSHSFGNCTSLKHIELPDAVESIGEGAFSRCSGLTSLTIPESVTSIGNAALSGITGELTINCNSSDFPGDPFTWMDFTTVIIGENVTSIGDNEFSYCSKLENFYCRALTPPILGESVFERSSSLTAIYVPRDSYDAYKNADGWSSWESLITPFDF